MTFGVNINNAQNNTVGGTTPSARNLISGNGINGFGGGINLESGATNNLVQGNFIGVAADGSTPMPNVNGVTVGFNATNNSIGGAFDGARNVISANTFGGIGNSSDDNSISNNFIGVDVTGTIARGNGSNGIRSTGFRNIFRDNVVSANNGPPPNGGHGIAILDGDENIVERNLVGTGPEGTLDFGNAENGMLFDRVSINNIVRNNVVSGNGTYGIEFRRNSNATVQGNFIGTDITGTSPLPNDFAGMSGGAGTLIEEPDPDRPTPSPSTAATEWTRSEFPFLEIPSSPTSALGLPSSPTTPAFKTSPL